MDSDPTMTHQPPVKQAVPQPHLLQNPRDSIMPRPSVTCLPPRVLSHVFLLYVALLDKPLSVTLPAQGPFCLGQVCSRWRTIAESDPRLWSFIHLSVPGSNSVIPHKNGTQRVALVFDLYLKRSGTLPISLTLYVSGHQRDKKLVFLLVDRLRTHSRRWKSISLDSSGHYFPDLTFTPCDLSSLEHLCIGELAACLDLEFAKNLKSFTYRGPRDLPVKNINPRWEQLEEFSLQIVGPYHRSGMSYEHLECLALCQNITTCSLHTRTEDACHYREWQKITLPCLRTLRVRLSKWASENKVIDYLILPQLQTLEIGAEDTSDCGLPLLIVFQFSDLLKRSKCLLRHLSIQDVNFISFEILRCLHYSDTLLSFRYIPDPLSQDDFGNLVCKLRVLPLVVRDQIDRMPGPLVPELREITLGTSVRAYLDTMVAVFRSRGGARAREAGVAPLQRVEAIFLHARHPSARHLTSPSVEATCLRIELAEWVSEMESERKDGGEVVGETLETSVDAFAVCKSSGQRYRYPVQSV